MMWDHIVERIRAIIIADAILGGPFGASFRMASSSGTPFSPSVPMMEYSLIADSETELWAPTIIQFDIWAPDVDVVVEAERRMRRLFHMELPTDFGGVRMWSEYIGGDVLATPDRNGFSGRGLRFRFTPLREQYAGLASPA